MEQGEGSERRQAEQDKTKRERACMMMMTVVKENRTLLDAKWVVERDGTPNNE